MKGLLSDRIHMQRGTDTPLKRFAVIGERCSGTNFAAHCVNVNLPLKAATWEDYGWKHGFPTKPAFADDTLFVVMLRDPVGWAKSMYVKPWHARYRLMTKDFSSFIRTRWDAQISPPRAFHLEDDSELAEKVLQWDRHPITGLPYDNLLRLRNDKMAGFLSMSSRAANVVFLRMDLLTSDPEQSIGRIAECFELIPRDLEVETTPRKMGQLRRPVPLSSPPPEELSAKDFEFFSSELDMKQEEKLGFVPFSN
ncbi:hypothetical protein ACMU_03995 [Actibacterium mucosum KCTC 23349]|uniref:Sulfotransferase domain-containing protein n=1 Tax=Actibacterium mucosum KCTC 23349 TaxID=1454373 RepID=A0A037ZGX9_9RHOB|nr:hypothetical protein [Actibacterium mucosum]KAJ54065.1 hypothetical protein ACMU_03995 [Actibacterium mucosum KCTC 23349]